MNSQARQSDILQPLSHSQRLIWTGQKLHPQVPLYNMAIAVTIRGPLDPAAFATAFQEVLAASGALRTVFREINGEPGRLVLDKLSYALPFHDYSAEPDPAARARAFGHERSRINLDPSRRLFDCALLRLGPDRHVWFLNQHHLITDAWSTALLYRHLGDAYHQASEGRTPGLPEIPSYEDFIAFQDKEKLRRNWAEARQFWKAASSRKVEPPSLYGACRRESSTATVRLNRPLGRQRSRALRALMEQDDLRALTPQMTSFNFFASLLVAWMARCSGEHRLGLGCLAHNRPLPVFKETTGVFIELFPLVAECYPHESFRSLNARIRDEALLHLQHSKTGASLPEFSRNCNVVLNYITASFGDFAGFEVETEWIHCGHGDAGHHLRLQVQDFDEKGEFVLQFDFNEAVFPGDRQEFAVSHFFALFDAFVQDPGQSIGAVHLPGKAERQFLLKDFNRSAFTLPAIPSVVDLIEQRARINPGAVAVSDRERALTYQQLNRHADAVAGRLREMGLGTGSVIALLLPRSVETVIGIVGILKAGAAYLPIDPRFPDERVRFMLEDSGARAVVAEAVQPGFEQPVFTIAHMLAGDRTNRGHPPASRDPAYVIYTSGSTGKPKGVVIEHRSLLNYALWAQSTYCGGHPSSFAFFTPLTFDLTVTSLFVPLVSGGEIVVYPESGTGGDFALLDVLEDNRVDLVKLTPSHLSMLRGRDLSRSRVKGLILGGEDLKRDLAAATLQAFRGGVTIYNEYGPTEATVGCMIHAFDPERDLGASVPIGIPAGNTQIYLLDEHLNPVPIGVTGEIFVGGAGLAREYLNHPGLTASRFIESPFEPGGRLYRTGDLARMTRQGVLSYCGRCDEQVKIRGVRTELGEIEATLAQHPGIDSAAVKLITHQPRPAEASHHCTKCGLPSNYPGASFDAEGVCHLCLRFESYKATASHYFRDMDDLRALFTATNRSPAGYDCMMLLSGGKDSTYALCRLVDLGLNVHAFSFDNGYLSDQAKANISRVVETLGVDHAFASTPAMKEIFADSLRRFSNVCNGCFKTVYTLAIKRAREMGIPYIVTGLSRGQFFETRLTEELFARDDPDAIDRLILDARKAYHRSDDVVNSLLDGSCFQSDALFEEVQFIDFYRYCGDSLDEILEYLDQRVPWIRPTDTGRSTNCLINDAGIFVHKRERGFHNYAFPYSWDVRMGHKKRDEALSELDDEIDEVSVRGILAEIGYRLDEPEQPDSQLAAYYVTTDPIPPGDLRAYLSSRLPAALVPIHFVQVERMPVTANGKLNREALPEPGSPANGADEDRVTPRNAIERQLADLWCQVLRLDEVGVHDNFFESGGDSILAIRISSRAREAGLPIEPNQLFRHPTIAELASLVGGSSVSQPSPGPPGSQPATVFEALDDRKLDQLARALKKLD